MSISVETTTAKPFVKWAGGKTWLLNTFEKYYPAALKKGKIKRYIEPFVGSGAVLFYILQNYDVEEAYIIDINLELIITYEIIKRDVESLIDYLKEKEEQYLSLDTNSRKEFYYSLRDQYNKEKADFDYTKYSDKTIVRAGQFIFLNRTCFNGLFRVNKSGHFNVPAGRYKNPTICHENNLRAASRVLQKVEILQGDYKQCEKYIDTNTFIYFDPPYRPLNVTSNFTSYSEDGFGEEEQKKLARFFRRLSRPGVYMMLSNSDPRNENEEDTFFYDNYKLDEYGNEDENIFIYTVKARRAINSNGNGRGEISELVITNYRVREGEYL